MTYYIHHIPGRLRIRAMAVFLFFLSNGALYAGDDDAGQKPTWLPQLLGAQFTAIYQNAPGFHSPYTGQDSFVFDHSFKQEATQTYGIYLGSQVTKSFQLYADFEMFRGAGPSKGLGLGGYVNGDVIRAGSADLGSSPYLARLYARYIIPLSGALGESLLRGMDQLPGSEPADRIEIKGGKLAALGRFRPEPLREQPEDAVPQLRLPLQPCLGLRLRHEGLLHRRLRRAGPPSLETNLRQLPDADDGQRLQPRQRNLQGAGRQYRAHLAPPPTGTVIRLLAFRNEGRMGDYRDAMAIGAATDSVPDVHADEQPGRVKYGFGVNIEQPLANEGETGLFARLGWANGANSTWCYAEVDRTASIGLQVSGSNWGRSDDRFGIAAAADGLTGSHRHYLAEGGIGMVIGDGALNYGLEEVFEAYYRIQLCRFVQLSPDFQYIENPGYNRDRGPVKVYGMRLRVYY